MTSSYWQTLQLALWNILHRIGPMDVVDILVVAVVIYELIILTRQTRGSAVLKGMIMLLLATAISNMIGLTALNWILTAVMNNFALVLVILFQPELRKVLESLGRGRSRGAQSREASGPVREIINCMTDLSRRRVGALIVIERSTGLKDIIETGTAVDGLITSQLLENIFEPNTPLHDGAVIIRGDRVVAAACILPLTDASGVNRDLGTHLGTRHRASIGISEATDAVAFIVSEETGIMSIAREGRLMRHQDAGSLQRALDEIYTDSNFTLLGYLRRWWKEMRHRE